MIEDEYGCVWDHCAEEVFWGERIPCLEDDNHHYAWWTLVGEDAQYMAYVEDKTEENGVEGPLWIYDLESGEQRMITEPDRRCTWIRADGNWIGCLEYGEWVGAYVRASDLSFVNVEAGTEWKIPNEERTKIASYSISGQSVTLVRRQEETVSGYLMSWDRVWTFDLVSGEMSMIADSVEEEYRSTNAEIAGDVVAYWRWSGLGSSDQWSELRFFDLSTLEDSSFKWWDYRVYGDNNSTNDFAFDGQWVAMDEGSGIRAYSVDGSREIDVAYCPMACQFKLSNGKISYIQSGADGLDQRQVHVFNLETEEDTQVTFCRPFWDGSSLRSFLGDRVLWSERRGENAFDDCGNFRTGSSDDLLFWRDFDD